MTNNGQTKTVKKANELVTKVGVSKNKKHIIVLGQKSPRRIITSREWRDGITQVRYETKKEFITGDIVLLVIVPKNRRADPSNYIEFFQDALQGRWYENDKQVRRGMWDESDGDDFIIRAKPWVKMSGSYLLDTFEAI